jgi:hypothetical protein
MIPALVIPISVISTPVAVSVVLFPLATLLAPAVVVVSFDHSLVRPVTWLVAVGAVFSPILGLDPT